MSDSTYLSIVVTTRNDNHGGDLLARTDCFLNGIYAQAKKFKTKLELIIVEWNPPADKPLLKDVLKRPDADDYVSLRYIILPSELHNKYRFAKDIPLYQMIAKNIGIRRAKGEYILCTNIDLLFSDDCFRKIANKEFEKNKFYRANRCDVPKEILDFDTFEDQLNFAEKNVMKVLGRNYNFQHVNGVPSFFFWFPNALKLLDNSLGLIKSFFPDKAGNAGIILLDTMACGDFTLMSKEDWHRIEGYCELDMYSLHVDSMALISASAIGMQQVIFPTTARSYHIYHENGWESDYKKPDDLIKFLVKRPALDWYTISESGKKLLAAKKPFKLNQANWGYNDIELEEHNFNPVYAAEVNN